MHNNNHCCEVKMTCTYILVHMYTPDVNKTDYNSYFMLCLDSMYVYTL